MNITNKVPIIETTSIHQIQDHRDAIAFSPLSLVMEFKLHIYHYVYTHLITMTLKGLTKILSPFFPDKDDHKYGPRKIMNKEGQDSIIESK